MKKDKDCAPDALFVQDQKGLCAQDHVDAGQFSVHLSLVRRTPPAWLHESVMIRVAIVAEEDGERHVV